MFNIYLLYAVLLLPGIVGLFYSFLKNLHLWQVKEYRLDRVLSYMRFEREKLSIPNFIFLLKLILITLGVLFFAFPEESFFSISFFLTYFILFLEFEDFLKDLVHSKIIRPRLKSIRNIIISVVFAIIVSMIYLATFSFINDFDTKEFSSQTQDTDFYGFTKVPTDTYNTIPVFVIIAGLPLLITIVLSVATPILASILVAFTAPLATYSRNKTINEAKTFLNNRKNDLKVIAITGSYGKSTTKEMIFDILNTKYKVAKTPANLNTTVGIAKSILTNIKDDTEIFVEEIGAYKKGEILDATKLLPPDVSVVTAVTNQHVSLFGSLEKLFLAKYELVEGLKQTGVAVLNGNNTNTLNMASRTDKKSVFFYHLPLELEINKKDEVATSNEDLYITKIEESKTGIDLNLSFKGESYKLKTNLEDKNFALNLSAAILACIQIGMPVKQAMKAAQIIGNNNSLPKTKKGINGSLIIDDGKTSNEQGFLTGLDILSKNKSKSKKVLVTQGIIELGTERQKVYVKIAKKMNGIVDVLITSDKSLTEYTRKFSPKTEIYNFDFRNVKSNILKSTLKEKDIVLLEGSMPEKFLKIIYGA